MRPIRSVSVLVPTHQGLEFLERCLTALAGQRLAVPWDFLAIDTSSTDGTWELLGRVAEKFPVTFRRERIHPVEFDHGDTRNLLASRTSGDLLVYLTQDAIPTSDEWLAKLVANFDDPRVAAAYCRNVARPGADVLTRVFSENDPGYAAGRRETRIEDREAYARMSPLEKRLLYNFNDVASAIRRELWELHPFPRTSFGEDVLMARALLEAGHTVVYDDQATVEHSHDYGPDEMRERAFIDGRFNAQWLGRICVESPQDAETLVKRQVEKDEQALAQAGLGPRQVSEEVRRGRALRQAVFEGLHEGGRTDVRRPSTKLLEKKHLSILYVVHGFPPDTWAGTEVYTLNLATGMQRRGHRVTVLARAPGADGGPEDFTVQAGAFGDLRVLRMVHRLRHQRIADTFRQPAAERAFRDVLAREKPDLVHFMHLIHFSAGLVGISRELGLPTVVTCHDFWSICARVQLIRPDGVRCDENMGDGCFLCVTDRSLPRIPLAQRFPGMARSFLRRFDGFEDMRERHAVVADAYRSADLRISPSRFLRRKLVATAGFEPETFLYSDNGMRTDPARRTEKRPDPKGRLRFGFVGSLVWYKGGEVMLRAMRRLQGMPATLAVHGDFTPETDPHHAALQRLAGDNVSFRGRFDNARAAEIYSEIDVLLVPSLWWENSPITIREAFLTGTPVIASGIGGMAESVRDGVDGLHFKPGDDADLAAAMRRFFHEKGLLQKLARNAPPVKTIEQDAAATEYRYRALCCVQRGGAS